MDNPLEYFAGKFTCKVCGEQYDIDYKSVSKRGNVCKYCSGELLSEKEDE